MSLKFECPQTDRRYLDRAELVSFRENFPALKIEETEEVSQISARCFCIYFASSEGKNYCIKTRRTPFPED
jgi:hypothetical protein